MAPLDLLAHVVDHPQVPLVFVGGSVLLGGLAHFVARRRGWRPVPAVLAACGLALVLSVTVVRPAADFVAAGWNPVAAARTCTVGSFSLADLYEQLNLLMLVPFALGAALALRRPLAAVAATVVVSGFIEYVQAATGGGTCQVRDVVHNTAGGVLAALAAWVLARSVSRERAAGRGSRR